MWELFTLFSFADSKQASKAVDLLTLEYGGAKGMLEERKAKEGLVEFDVSQAHCYDPNEEAKLRWVRLVGQEQPREGPSPGLTSLPPHPTHPTERRTSPARTPAHSHTHLHTSTPLDA